LDITNNFPTFALSFIMAKLILKDGVLKRPPNIQGKEADYNHIVPYKERTIDAEKPIHLYRNLTKKGIWYSIKQDGFVVAHATAICMSNVTFMIKKWEKERAIRTKIRNVHAFIVGRYATSGMGTSAERNDLPIRIKYNPFSNFGFYYEMCDDKKEIKGARFIIANKEGVKGAYIY
jgi:hypothetical protein